MKAMRVRAEKGIFLRAFAMVTAILALATGIGILGYFLRETGRVPLEEAPAAALDIPTPTTPSPPPELPKKKVSIFYIEGSSGALSPESREIYETKGSASQAKQALALLLAGPEDRDRLLPVFPEEAKLVGLFLSDEGQVYLDFSSEITRPTGVTEELRGLAALALTLSRNFPEIEHMSILIEGKQLSVLRGHLSIDYPLVTKDATYDALIETSEPGATPGPSPTSDAGKPEPGPDWHVQTRKPTPETKDPADQKP